MTKLEQHRKTWQGKSDEWLFERLALELKDKIETIHNLLAENERLRIANVRLSFVDWVSENYPTLKNHGDSLTLSELRTAYNQYTNEA